MAVKNQRKTLLKGTPYEHTFIFENPDSPTENDIAKV